MSSDHAHALDASVLVLNRLFMAIHVISVRRAFCLLCKELAEVVSVEDGQYASYNFENWREVSEFRARYKGPDDDWIRTVSRLDARVVLTRDRELLKCRTITHGCFVHALKPHQQLREVVERLHLAASARPFTLCLHCNLKLAPIPKEAIAERLPPRVAAAHERYAWCQGCDRIYWEGSHWRRMRAMLKGLVDAVPEDRASADFDERLGDRVRLLAQPGAPAAAEDHDGLVHPRERY